MGRPDIPINLYGQQIYHLVYGISIFSHKNRNTVLKNYEISFWQIILWILEFHPRTHRTENNVKRNRLHMKPNVMFPNATLKEIHLRPFHLRHRVTSYRHKLIEMKFVQNYIKFLAINFVYSIINKFFLQKNTA